MSALCFATRARASWPSTEKRNPRGPRSGEIAQSAMGEGRAGAERHSRVSYTKESRLQGAAGSRHRRRRGGRERERRDARRVLPQQVQTRRDYSDPRTETNTTCSDTLTLPPLPYFRRITDQARSPA
jgi:hypothetical protein